MIYNIKKSHKLNLVGTYGNLKHKLENNNILNENFELLEPHIFKNWVLLFNLHLHMTPDSSFETQINQILHITRPCTQVLHLYTSIFLFYK